MKPFASQYGALGDDFELAKTAKSECHTCVVHAAATLALHGVACPACGEGLKTHNAANEVVGEHLGDAYAQRYAKVPVVDCHNCGLLVALWPVPISHDERCDVLYLGGLSVWPSDFYAPLLARLTEQIRPAISRFLSLYRTHKELKSEGLIQDVSRLAAQVLADNFKAAGVVPGEHKMSQIELDVILGAAGQACANGCEPECFHDKARVLAAIYKLLPEGAPLIQLVPAPPKPAV